MLTVFLVDSLADEVAADGSITLREALEAANTNTAVHDAPAGSGTQPDTITFAPELFADGADPLPGVITLGGTQLELVDDLDFQGPGAELLSIDAQWLSRVFRVGSNAEVSLSGLTITGGPARDGGGIYIDSGTLTVTNSTLSANDGGGIYNISGAVTVTDSTIEGNSGGGIYSRDGTLTVTNSTISGNSASRGGGIYNRHGTLTVTNSTISGNSAGYVGGGIYNDSGTMTVTNSTISGNSASNDGGGIYSREGTLSVTNSTISGNSAGYFGTGGGIYNQDMVFGTGKVYIRNTIVAGNETGDGGGSDVYGDCVSQGHNLIGDRRAARGFRDGVNGDQVGGGGKPAIDPQLGPLRNNGGPTQTHALLPGSPAIDMGSNSDVPQTDQRGFYRIRDGNHDSTATVDIGAFEFESVLAPLLVIDDVSVVEGDSGTMDAVFTVSLLEPSPLTVAVDYFTATEYVAREGSDYQAVSGTLTFAPSDVSKTVTVVVHGDAEVEPNETFVVNLRNVNHAIIVDDQGVGTIVNDDWTGFVVDSFEDAVDANPGDGIAQTSTGVTTLRAAIMEANALEGDETVMVPPGAYTLSLAGTDEDGAARGDLDIIDTTGSLTVFGAGAGATIVDASGLDRAFHVLSSATADLYWMTITGASAGADGGISNRGGTLTVTNSTISGNPACGISNRGGTVTVTNSTIEGNSSVEGGGILNGSGTMTVNNSTISGNSASIKGGGISSWGGTVTVTNSTISGNSASSEGGGICSEDGTLTVTNSTISGNSARNHFGGGHGGGISNWDATLTVTNSTIADNSAHTSGGEIRNLHGMAYMRNTIVAGSGGSSNEVYGTFVSQGHNLIGDVATATGFSDGVNGDQVGGGGKPRIDPQLGPLHNNGGPTQTHALLPGSPAIDMGSNGDVPPTDQRGFARIVDGDGDGTATIDVGAVEHVPTKALVLGRHVFYNNSSFDGNDPTANQADDAAIATDKRALLAGQAATFANYTSYVRGLNGIMVDMAGLTGTPTMDDFEFKVGNDNNSADWTTAPKPSSITTRPGDGMDGSDRLTLIWPDNAIEKQWLQVTVLATENTGLAEPDVFYFGNAIGEAGNSALNVIVNATDEIVARNFQHGPTNLAAIDDPYDYNRDQLVNSTDRTIARNNQTGPISMLRLISVPAADAALQQAAEPLSASPETSLGELDWLHEFEQIGVKKRPSKTYDPIQAAVDMLLATYGT